MCKMSIFFKVFLVLCSSVFTTFYRVRVWRCSSPWLSLYAGCRTPLSFFFPCWPSREQLKHQAKGVIARLVYSRQKWDVSGPITALLTVTDDVCPSENTDERTKNASQRTFPWVCFSSKRFTNPQHDGGKSLKISHCAAQCLNIIKNISFLLHEIWV